MITPQQERFSRLQFPVHKVTAKNPVEFFETLPGLRRYFQRYSETLIDVEYKKGDGTVVREKVKGHDASYRGLTPDDLVKIFKYIVFVYDADSDLITEYPDDHRLLKEAAAKEAGWRRNKDGEFPPYVQDILNFKEKHVAAWILDYMKVKRNPIYKEIVFVEQELEVLYRSRTDALVSGRVDASLMSQIKQRLDEKDNLYKRFYAEHLDLKKATQDDLYPVSPENVFNELKIPPEIRKVRQVKDVSKDTGVLEVHN